MKAMQFSQKGMYMATKCPYMSQPHIPVNVASVTCQGCKYNLGIDWDKQIVSCVADVRKPLNKS